MVFFMKRSLPLIRVFLLVAVLLSAVFPVASANSLPQADEARQKARSLLNKLTPEERIGQLFLVTFQGTNTASDTPIYTLITKYHIGGVVLQRKNNNFNDQESLLLSTFNLIHALQEIEWQQSQSEEQSYQYIPLFVGISQEGDLAPNDQILSSLTPLPNLMAIGATWDTGMAQQVGTVLGSELSALGFNLILGPSLDVLDVPYTVGKEDLGSRTFGGDPYWVSEMGKAYIAGIHQGSGNKIAVIAKHFPGRGSSDRQPEEEIATVRKTFEQLKQVELAPFIAVTSTPFPADTTTDGLLLSHIRYQGFQKNIRATTNPLSFDRTALNEILSLPEFSRWRENGGVIISDNLGSPAIQRFFDPSGTNFDARQVTRNAFLAGNDILYIDSLISTGDTDSFTTLTRILESFTQKYNEDPTFAQRVDDSVERILTLKFRLYPDFNFEEIAPSEANLGAIGKSQKVTFDVAARAATLISPDFTELISALPSPPQPRDRLVFFTDAILSRQCTTCAEKSMPAINALQNTVLQLYGPQAGAQVSSNRLSSYSFLELWQALRNQEGTEALVRDIQLADWLIFSILNETNARPESSALRQLLSERPDWIRNKKIIVFAFNAPYYLDATDISKLNAYYALYGKASPFIDVAARLLFQEMSPSGASPVSIPGIGYDLIEAMSPDPNQIISLQLDIPEGMVKPGGSPEATPIPTFKIGDVIPLKTGVILDHNRHPVPDGTPVRFYFSLGGESGMSQVVETVTQNGIARASYRIERGGLLEIRVASEPAINSNILRLDITSTEGAVVTAILPTPIPTETPTPTTTSTPEVTPTSNPEPVQSRPAPTLSLWLLSTLLSLGGAFTGGWLGMHFLPSPRWAVRLGLTVLMGGVLAYLYLALGLPGSKEVLIQTWKGILWVTGIGMLIGGLVGYSWHEVNQHFVNFKDISKTPRKPDEHST